MQKHKLTTLFLLIVLNLTSIGQTPVLNFDGTDDYLNLGPNVANNVRTIELWLKPSNDINQLLPNYQIVLARENSLYNWDEFNLSFHPSNTPTAGKLCFRILDGVGNYYEVYSNNNYWVANEWHHVAIVIHNSLGMMMFIDGILQSNIAPYFNAIVPYNNSTYVGCQGNLFIRYYQGAIEDLHFSTDAIYTSNFTPPCPGRALLLTTNGLYYFNEGSGTVANDISQFQNTGSIHGAVFTTDTICSSTSQFYDTIVGCFDGIDDWVNIGSNVANNCRTIEFWMKPGENINHSLSEYRVILARESGTSNLGEFNFSFHPNYVPNAGKLCFRILDGVGNYYEVFSNQTFWVKDKWYHIAVCLDPNDGMKLFINGIMQNSISSFFNPIPSNNFDTYIGCQGASNIRHFIGCIDDLRFSEDTLYNKSFIPICPNASPEPYTKGLYNFNNINSNILNDISNNNNDGLIFDILSQIEYPCDSIVGILVHATSLKRISVYPNPSCNNISVFTEYTEDKTLTASIYNSSMNKMLTTNINSQNNKINLNEQIPNGVYFLCLEEDGIIIGWAKFIKF